jgi:hypothetical protein
MPLVAHFKLSSARQIWYKSIRKEKNNKMLIINYLNILQKLMYNNFCGKTYIIEGSHPFMVVLRRHNQ